MLQIGDIAAPGSQTDAAHAAANVGGATVGVLRAMGEFQLLVLRTIALGETLFEIEGQLTQTPSRYSVQIDAEQHIDLAGEHSEREILDRYFWRFMNHSCDPSVIVVDRSVRALRDLASWDAVTFNYNTTEWDMAEPFDCRCGADNCLFEIKGFRHLTQAQIAALPLVPPFLDQLRAQALSAG